MTQLFLILSMCISSVLAITVDAGSYFYSPQDLVIDVGETVQWENVGGTHDVDGTTNNITDEPWNNPEDFYLGSTGIGDMGSKTFTIPGVYNYDCGVGSHAANGMVGTITVNSISDQGCQDSDDCEDGSFCNMDYTYDYSSSSCESCGGFTEIEDCYTAGLPDAGEDECAITCFNGDDCSMYGDEYSCDSDDSCYWENDGMGGGYCEHDGPPECVEDCAGIDDLNDDDPYTFCNWITTTLVNSGCADDCDGEELEEVNEVIQECTDCLAENNCEDVIGGDDDCHMYNDQYSCEYDGCIWDEYGNYCYDDDCASGIYDCAGDCDGSAELDDCGVCNGDGFDIGNQGVCDCDGNVFDCSGVCNGSDFSCDMMRTSYFGLYENNDCSGEFLTINGMCLTFGENDLDPFTMFNEETCINSGELWLLANSCNVLTFLFSLEQEACEENGSLWIEETDEYGYTQSMCIDVMTVEDINNEDDCEEYDGMTMWVPDFSENGPMLYIYNNGIYENNGIWSASEEEHCRYSSDISQEDCENAGAEWDEYDNECNVDDQQTCESIGGVWYLDGVHEQGSWSIYDGEITLTAYDGTDLPGPILGADFSSNEMGDLLTLNIQFEAYEFMDDYINEPICIEYGFENIDPQLENTNVSIPNEIKIENIYPNPFNPTTTIDFSVSEPNHIDINIYDLNGKFIKSINSKQYSVGNHSETIDISDFTSGVYFVRLELENRFLTQKLMLLK